MSGMEQFVYGLIVTLIGMGVVFTVLIALVYLIEGIRVFSNKDKPKKKEKLVETIEEVAEIEYEVEEKDDNELIAAISAALSYVMGNDRNLIIKSIVRANDQTPVWAKSGRQDQMLNRL